MQTTHYTIIAGNPIDGFSCTGIFESEHEAIDWANHDAHLDDSWHVIAIQPIDE
jgi:hypothetical protein